MTRAGSLLCASARLYECAMLWCFCASLRIAAGGDGEEHVADALAALDEAKDLEAEADAFALERGDGCLS